MNEEMVQKIEQLKQQFEQTIGYKLRDAVKQTAEFLAAAEEQLDELPFRGLVTWIASEYNVSEQYLKTCLRVGKGEVDERMLKTLIKYRPRACLTLTRFTPSSRRIREALSKRHPSR